MVVHAIHGIWFMLQRFYSGTVSLVYGSLGFFLDVDGLLGRYKVPVKLQELSETESRGRTMEPKAPPGRRKQIAGAVVVHESHKRKQVDRSIIVTRKNCSKIKRKLACVIHDDV